LAVTIKDTEAKIYLNGLLIQTKTFTAFTTLDSLYIGQHGTSGAYRFRGLIDDFRIYQKTLSADEVKKLSQAKIAHYRMDDSSIGLGETVKDYSKNNFNGIIYSGTAPITSTDSGIRMNSLQFDGVDDYIDFGDIIFDSDFTVSG
jgi:hypothetical protein